VKHLAVVALALSLVGCAAGNPWSALRSVPSGTEERTVLLLGDSLLDQTAPYLPGALAWRGMSATIVDESYPGTGLLDPGIVAVLEDKIDAFPAADIVVIEFTGNCFVCPVPYGSSEFFAQWSANLQAVFGYVLAQGKHAVLALPPPQRPDLSSASVQLQLAVQAYFVTIGGAAVLANWREALTDTAGNYQQFLYYADPFADPAVHMIRRDDGVHLTDDGAKRAADWTAAALRQFWASR
jgi:hypothetical protein